MSEMSQPIAIQLIELIFDGISPEDRLVSYRCISSKAREKEINMSVKSAKHAGQIAIAAGLTLLGVGAISTQGLARDPAPQFHLAQATVTQEAISLYERARQLVDRDEQAAVELLDRAVQLDPNLTQVYVLRGTIYADRGQSDRAIADYRQAIQQDPDQYLTHYFLGIELFKLQQPSEALAAFNRSVELNPDFGRARGFRGSIRGVQFQDYQGAIEDLTFAANWHQQRNEADQAQKAMNLVRSLQQKLSESPTQPAPTSQATTPAPVSQANSAGNASSGRGPTIKGLRLGMERNAAINVAASLLETPWVFYRGRSYQTAETVPTDRDPSTIDIFEDDEIKPYVGKRRGRAKLYHDEYSRPAVPPSISLSFKEGRLNYFSFSDKFVTRPNGFNAGSLSQELFARALSQQYQIPLQRTEYVEANWDRAYTLTYWSYDSPQGYKITIDAGKRIIVNSTNSVGDLSF